MMYEMFLSVFFLHKHKLVAKLYEIVYLGIEPAGIFEGLFVLLEFFLIFM